MPRLFQAAAPDAVDPADHEKERTDPRLKANKGLLVIQSSRDRQVVPVIDGPYTLSEVPKAFQLFGEGRQRERW